MKKLLYIITAALILGTGAAHAQKIGHVNSQEILFELPAYKDAEAKMKEFTTERMKDYEALKTKYQQLMNEYNVLKEKKASEAELKLKEEDIMSIQSRIDGFEQEYQTNLQKREQILMEPLIKQVKDAISKVAKAQGLNYVVDTGTLLYIDGGTDLSPLVKKELNITTAPAGPTTPTTPAKTPGK